MKRILIAIMIVTIAISPAIGLADEAADDYECCGVTITQEQETSLNDDSELSGEIKQICVEIGESYVICPELIMAVIERESKGDVFAENGTCKGLMQVSEYWHSDRMQELGVSDLYDAYGNVLVGTDYLVELIEKYEDVALALMIYHGESDALEKAEGGEISAYAEWILERSADLERQHGK